MQRQNPLPEGALAVAVGLVVNGLATFVFLGIASRTLDATAYSALGVFWALELVRDRQTREPLVPFNAAGPAAAGMNEVAAACKERGLWPFIHFNRLHVVPPCTTTDEEAKEGLAILDDALAVADRYATS